MLSATDHLFGDIISDSIKLRMLLEAKNIVSIIP